MDDTVQDADTGHSKVQSQPACKERPLPPEVSLLRCRALPWVATVLERWRLLVRRSVVRLLLVRARLLRSLRRVRGYNWFGWKAGLACLQSGENTDARLADDEKENDRANELGTERPFKDEVNSRPSLLTNHDKDSSPSLTRSPSAMITESPEPGVHHPLR